MFLSLSALSPSVCGLGRSRVVDCLTKLGIVCFPAAPSFWHSQRPWHAAGKHYEAGEGVSTALLRPNPHTRLPPKTNQAKRVTGGDG
jgi:hypothetical protein